MFSFIWVNYLFECEYDGLFFFGTQDFGASERS